jgi:hypothetical protein
MILVTGASASVGAEPYGRSPEGENNMNPQAIATLPQSMGASEIAVMAPPADRVGSARAPRR